MSKIKKFCNWLLFCYCEFRSFLHRNFKYTTIKQHKEFFNDNNGKVGTKSSIKHRRNANKNHHLKIQRCRCKLFLTTVKRTKLSWQVGWVLIMPLLLQLNHSLQYRVSKKKLTPFIFKLASNLLLEFDNSHVYSQQDVGNSCFQAQ